MRIEKVELRQVRMPLCEPFRTSYGAEEARSVLLVRVSGSGTEGWGECAADAEPLYSPEHIDGAALVMRDHLLPRVFSAGGVSAEDLGGILAPVRGHQMAKAAIEMAVLDAELRHTGASLAAYLGGVRELVPAGVAVGIPASVEELLDVVAQRLNEGYLRVKLKIRPGWDVEPVRAVRERFGDVVLQVDANCAYSLDDAAALVRLDAFGLAMIEQPLNAEDLLGHAELARLLRTPICLDESITSARTAKTAISLGACSIVNVKAGRVGGYLEAKRVHDACTELGVPLWCGGMLDTGLARAANAALASLPGFVLPGDLSASDRYWHRDITEPFVLEDGHLRVPSGPGIGVAPLPPALEELTTSVEVLRR